MKASRLPERVYRFGLFQMDPEEGTLLRQGLPVKIHGQPLQVLRQLLERPGKIVARDELRRSLWPDGTYVEFDVSLNSALKRLRAALGDNAENPMFVETIPKRGYRFIAPVEASFPEGKGDLRPSRADAIRGHFTARVMDWPWMLGASGAVLLAALAGLAFAVRARRARRFPDIEVKSIAVLPLENVSGDSAQDYIAEGLTDQLTTDLAEIGSLRVTSRTSAEHFKGTTETLPHIAKELSVDAIVEGTVAREGQEVRITAQLIGARYDRHLWAETYQVNLGDMFMLEAEVAQRIAGRIQAKLAQSRR